jgi:hypothetical protein
MHVQFYAVRCVYMYTYCSQYRDAGRAKVILKMGQKGMPGAKEVFPHAISDMRAVG